MMSSVVSTDLVFSVPMWILSLQNHETLHPRRNWREFLDHFTRESPLTRFRIESNFNTWKVTVAHRLGDEPTTPEAAALIRMMSNTLFTLSSVQTTEGEHPYDDPSLCVAHLYRGSPVRS
jgi:hypothetical protein